MSAEKEPNKGTARPQREEIDRRIAPVEGFVTKRQNVSGPYDERARP